MVIHLSGVFIDGKDSFLNETPTQSLTVKNLATAKNVEILDQNKCSYVSENKKFFLCKF